MIVKINWILFLWIYDTTSLLDLKNLKFVYYKRRLKRFVKTKGEIFK